MAPGNEQGGLEEMNQTADERAELDGLLTRVEAAATKQMDARKARERGENDRHALAYAGRTVDSDSWRIVQSHTCGHEKVPDGAGAACAATR